MSRVSCKYTNPSSDCQTNKPHCGDMSALIFGKKKKKKVIQLYVSRTQRPKPLRHFRKLKPRVLIHLGPSHSFYL